jgi:hypothetical protein
VIAHALHVCGILLAIPLYVLVCRLIDVCNEQKQLPVLLIGPPPTLLLPDPHYPSFPLDIPARIHAEINLLSSVASYPSMPVSSGLPPYFTSYGYSMGRKAR